MKKAEFVTNLAISFNEEIMIKVQGEHIPNIKLTNVFDFIESKFDEGPKLKKFYDLIVRWFKPTQAEKFPSVATIRELFERFLDQESLEKNKHIPFTEREMYQAYALKNGVTFEPPEGMENATLQERLKDYENLNDDQMLLKYGIRLTGEVWQYVHENESKIKNPDYFHD